MFADENERRHHVETKHHACGYCYQADFSMEHMMKEHLGSCIWCHEQGLFAPSFAGTEDEIRHLKRYHPRTPKILA